MPAEGNTAPHRTMGCLLAAGDLSSRAVGPLGCSAKPAGANGARFLLLHAFAAPARGAVTRAPARLGEAGAAAAVLAGARCDVLAVPPAQAR